jgi:hypothetical protein
LALYIMIVTRDGVYILLIQKQEDMKILEESNEGKVKNVLDRMIEVSNHMVEASNRMVDIVEKMIIFCCCVLVLGAGVGLTGWFMVML